MRLYKHAAALAVAIAIAGTAAALFPPTNTIVPCAIKQSETVIKDQSEEANEWDNVTELARLIWGEARGVSSTMQRAAIVWCVLNRVDDPRWPDTVQAAVTQPWQFAGYSQDFPATDENKAIAADVLTRWELEKIGAGDVGRVLPAEYVYFTGDGKQNHFTTIYKDSNAWTWTSRNPYKTGITI